MIQKGKVSARKVKRAQILLAADQGTTDETIAKTVAVGTSTVYRTKQRFVEEGLERALRELVRSGAPRKFNVEDEAMLCAVACSAPPSGRARRTRGPGAHLMVSQCLDRRIPDKATLVTEVANWERRRNTEKAQINWMFTVDRARVKLHRAYPTPADHPAQAAA